MKKVQWDAKWIWCRQNDLHAYNQTVCFRKNVELKKTGPALLHITADCWYRVSINGRWVHDGPAKAYPEYYLFDSHDVSSLLKKGRNRIDVIARYYGIGTFHQLPQQAGLIAQLETEEGTIGTDSSWQASPSLAWKQWTPKISVQMEPVEEVDARLLNKFDWQPAVEIMRSGKLSPRPVGLLTKLPRRLSKLHSAVVVNRASPRYTVPVTQIAHPGIIEANGHTTRPVVLLSELTVHKKQQFNFAQSGLKSDFLNPGGRNWLVAVNGRILKTGKVTLDRGTWPVLFFCASFTGHEKDLAFPCRNMSGGTWGKWRAAVIDEFLYRDNDRLWFGFPHEKIKALHAAYLRKTDALARACKTIEDVNTNFSPFLRDLPEEQIFMGDFVADFAAREPVGSASRLFDGKIVKPSRKGDVELCFDLGEQSCGYFDFQIRADAGVVIDFNAVEYIAADGTIQHVQAFNRNGMRYITAQGANRFTSLKRRAGRYLFLTFRNLKTPAEIRSLRIIESTAPVTASGSFECSDSMLNRLWNISERTLQLCMEDTFTDCPLYEQTLWIGDARNEALYAFTAYANYDVSAHSLELGAQSLDRFPIVGCQVPSSWDCILPAWSFLWGLQAWEHYFYSGDRRFLKKIWPAVRKNMEGALGLLNADGLFSGRFWNLIEWAPIDQDQPTVLHNNMLLAGALHAAEKCAAALGEQKAGRQFAVARRELVRAVNKTWNDSTKSYPDSIHGDGTPSSKICQQTSMLSVMCDVVPANIRDAVRRNLLNPPKGMTTVGAPFAMQFMYEALEKLDELEAILSSMHDKFRPMVESGASTVWEMFPGSDFQTYGFPTRSHCHAWSSSPIYFLNRIVLGIRQVEPGAKAFEISPWVDGLQWARGTTATGRGAVSVEWTLQSKILDVVITAPKGIHVAFVPNRSHQGLCIKQKILRL
ncbi:MAG: alpha-L-rhamnosidase C-terminal domain-containing protein [Kiritimatiellales bacterium]